MPVQEAERSGSTQAEATNETSPVPKPVIAFFAAVRKVLGRAEDFRETVHEPPTVKDRGTWNLEMVVSPDELDGGFIAECPDLPGAVAQGETEEEALESLVDAVQGIVAAKMEEHLRSIDFDMPSNVTRRIRVRL
jgi:predicted RNase H-like HicB family nuclease